MNLLDKSTMPILGQGTWGMGENPDSKEKEVKALRHGIKNGLSLIDTAEMYGNGGAELVVGKAIKDFNREDLYIVSKVYPHNAGKDNIFTACENSLKRLGTDYLDMYLLHWRGSIPLEETVECMEKLVKLGKIKGWGVSNFDTDDMKELWQIKDGQNCLLNQVLYHLGSRGIEFNLLPWMKENKVATMAYCPIAQGGRLKRGLLDNPAVNEVAKKHGISQTQVLLAFVLNQENLIAIPKASSINHIDKNIATLNVKLDNEDIALLNEHYPAPNHKTFLDIV